MPGNGDIGYLEGNAATMAEDLGADFDRLLLQARQRPVLDLFRRCQRGQKITEVEGECMKLQAHCVAGERPA